MKQFKNVLKSEELRVYIAICLIATALITVNTVSSIDSLSTSKAIRDAFFQVTTIISTTGFSTVDYSAIWPSFSKTVLVLLMVIGACAGSTAGGLKISRVIIAVKNVFRSLKHTIRPKSVNVVRLDGEVQSTDTLHAVSNHIVIYTAVVAVTTLLISIDGADLETNFTATLSCISNIGPGLGAVGPMGNFADYSYFSKLLLSLVMLVGRLEFIPMMILFSPSTWKKH